MAFDAKVVRVMIASPGDTGSARTTLRELLADWNGLNAEETSVMLLPVMWEQDATPEMGDRPQGIINRQLVDEADVMVGVFWTRLGTPTGQAESGTAEEIERFIEADKPVLIYFSNQPVHPSSVVPEEYARLNEFRDSLGQRGLYDTYESDAELWRKVNAGLTRVMRGTFRLATVATPDAVDSSTRPTASLVVNVQREREFSGVSKQGKPQYRTHTSLVVENRGTAAAEQLTFEFERLGPDGTLGQLPEMMQHDSVVNRLAPGGRLEFSLLLFFGVVPQWDVILRWSEDGESREERQTVSV